MEAWTDERLDDLAAALRPLPAQMARNTEAIERVSEDMRDMRAEMRDMRAEMRVMRGEMHTQFSALQRQLALIGWTMSFSLVGVVVAVIVSGG